jgi:outer membrane protein OmpA-like peptidoglycan-associated protein
MARVCAGLGLFLLGSVAAAEPLAIQLRNQVPPGQKPALLVTAAGGAQAIRVELDRLDDGKHFTAAAGRLKPGQQATLAFGDGKAGRFRWQGKLIADLPDGKRLTNELTFETATTGEVHVTYARDRLDLEARKLEFQMSRPAGKATIVVIGDDGSELGRGEASYAGEKPGTWLAIAWPAARPGNVLRLELRAEDSAGLATLVKLIPWSVHIPHEEVVFATGKWDIEPAEERKLDASYARIIAAAEKVRKHEPTLPIRVYIAGHTDTVGSTDDNRKLSLARAKAIATWYRDRGLPLPLAYAGFGEDVPKVKTPDNIDEARNRRADYILGAEEPLLTRTHKANWHNL